MQKIQDIRNAESTICVVTTDGATAERINSEISSNLLLSKHTECLTVRSIEDLSDKKLKDVCVVLFHINPHEFGTAKIEWLNTHIEDIRAKFSSVTFVFIGFGENINKINQRSIIAVGGIDIILERFDKNAPANIFGLIRYTRMILNWRLPKTTRHNNMKIEIPGGWTLLPQRIVRLPDESTVQLTEAEWNYLRYLVDRDIKKSAIAENTEREVGQSDRQNAMVYKLRKKLGASFPIVPAGSGGYRLAI